MDTRSQILTILAVSLLAMIALGGTIFLCLHGRTVPESLAMLASNAVSGLCGALAPMALKTIRSEQSDSAKTESSAQQP